MNKVVNFVMGVLVAIGLLVTVVLCIPVLIVHAIVDWNWHEE